MLGQGMSLTNLREENSCGNIFTSLIEILKKELAVYQELKSTIICEKKIITKPTLHELNHNNALKENIILKARMLEEARINILKKIARNLDISTKNIKLTQLAGYAGPEQGKEIEEIRDDLVLISQEINALNAANKDLLDASMGNIKSSLDFISAIMSSGSVYMECGKIKSMHEKGTYLHKEG
jgi:flagellar biosynthesis/type III secretory pathway chaperone